MRPSASKTKPSTGSPGEAKVAQELWGTFASLSKRAQGPRLFVVDARVADLFPKVKALALGAPHVLLRGGESAKNIRSLERILGEASTLPRSAGTIYAIGGGTIGDVATVAAHLVKRGVRLVQVPTTLLAAVDSSLGGKGAVDLSTNGRLYKNAAGVFHYADETWICTELFETLNERQIREGSIEAWKMVVCLDPKLYSAYSRRAPNLRTLIRDARELKTKVCTQDPYETRGIREVLNFGHTIGHAVESLSGFKLSHGEAVGLGILAALDVGRAMGVTSEIVAAEVEETFAKRVGVLPRAKMGRLLMSVTDAALLELVRADKKNRIAGEVKMVLLERPGTTKFVRVPVEVLVQLARSWRKSLRP